MVMVCFLKKTQEVKEESNLFFTVLLPGGGQAMVRMQAGTMSCPLEKMWAD